MTTSECRTCGYPTLRAGAHASWCARVALWLRQCPAPGASVRGRYAEWERGTARYHAVVAEAEARAAGRGAA